MFIAELQAQKADFENTLKIPTFEKF